MCDKYCCCNFFFGLFLTKTPSQGRYLKYPRLRHQKRGVEVEEMKYTCEDINWSFFLLFLLLCKNCKDNFEH